MNYEDNIKETRRNYEGNMKHISSVSRYFWPAASIVNTKSEHLKLGNSGAQRIHTVAVSHRFHEGFVER